MNIDVDQLSIRLGELWWDEEYSLKFTRRELYQSHMHEGHGLYRYDEIKEEHATVFWNRIEFYKGIIESYETDSEE